jgi:phage-related protein
MAPCLAPRNLVSFANVRADEHSIGRTRHGGGRLREPTRTGCWYPAIADPGWRLRASSVRRSWHARIVARTQAVYYRDPRGTEPVDEFIQALPSKRAAKIDDFVEEYLNGQPPEAPPPAFPITSQLEGELRELRVRFASTRYRILYQRSENLVVLLHAIEKDTGAVPRGDIELAKQRMADFKRRMDAIRRRPPRAAGKDAPSTSRPV